MVSCSNVSEPWNKSYNPEKDPSIERDIAFNFNFNFKCSHMILLDNLFVTTHHELYFSAPPPDWLLTSDD